MSKKKNTNNNTEEVKTIINNMNEQINEMKQKMNILIEKLAENGNEETNIITKKSAKNKVKRNKQKTETNVVADIPNQANSDNTDNSKVVKTRNKKTKAETFQNERTLFIDELEKKMGLTETNRGVLLYELENNEELKKYLRDKIPEIQKLYKCGSWNYFKTSKDTKNNEIGLLKSIFKNENYKLLNKQVLKEIDGNKKFYSDLHFLKIQ